MTHRADHELRVLVIDDSPYLRQTIAELLDAEPGVRVVGRVGDGREGLREVLRLQPDLITLDLEMPELDGFGFLRLLMTQRSTPVLVVTSRPGRADLFRAIELGAFDVVVKPSTRATPEVRSMAGDLLAKVRQIRDHLHDLGAPQRRRLVQSGPHASFVVAPPEQPPLVAAAPARLMVIGASTGGPPAVQRVLSDFVPDDATAAVIAQHMPASFMRSFAERLARTTRWPVREASDGDHVVAGRVLVAPGEGALTLRRDESGLRVSLSPTTEMPFAPSIDLLFTSAAATMRQSVIALVLTGMRGDGVAGALAVREAGGHVLAESRESAVVFGMPGQAIAAGAVHEVLSLERLADAVARFAARPS